MLLNQNLIMKKKRIKIPIYGGELIVYILSNKKGIKKVAKRHKLGSTFGVYGMFFYEQDKNGSMKYYIVLPDDTPSWLIAHECIHFKNEVFKHLYIKNDQTNDEPEAYFITWAVKQCQEVLTKYGSRK